MHRPPGGPLAVSSKKQAASPGTILLKKCATAKGLGLGREHLLLQQRDNVAESEEIRMPRTKDELFPVYGTGLFSSLFFQNLADASHSPGCAASPRKAQSGVPYHRERPASASDRFKPQWGWKNRPEAKQSLEQVGQYYSIPLPEVKTMFPHGFPKRFRLQVKTFNEACFMVRPPALELINYLQHANFTHPAVRYVFCILLSDAVLDPSQQRLKSQDSDICLPYGEKGVGKTMALCHVVHYCARQDWLILHVPDVHRWVKNSKELLPSSYNKERLDQPLEASAWLKNFKITNERFLKEDEDFLGLLVESLSSGLPPPAPISRAWASEACQFHPQIKTFLLQLKTQQTYWWSKRDSTEEGSPLMEVVEQGLTRVKNASDAVGVVLKELKRQSPQGSFRLLVAVDGVNALWGPTALKKEDKSQISPEELTLIHNLRKMLSNDWSGGAVVTTLSQTGALFQPRRAYLPHELLGKDGFEALDPFVPIQVLSYTDQEFESCYQYYLDRRWLQHEKASTDGGKQELLFLSGGNPAQFERLSASL
ncbi:hypothetical protein lerEdw1_002951 [Lerista edwardsae]|nr:hypothetical protein lerEdw1_002951 [Lerista edwardsae]